MGFTHIVTQDKYYAMQWVFIPWQQNVAFPRVLSGIFIFQQEMMRDNKIAF